MKKMREKITPVLFSKFVFCVRAAAAGYRAQTDGPKLSPAGLRMKADALLLLLLLCFSLLSV